jgi:hypothetical protein
MIRRGEVFWRMAIEQQRTSGLNATRFCKKRSLKRGTFLRWRKRLIDSANDQDFVEVSKIVRIPLKAAGRSGVILPPVYIMLNTERESTHVAGMAQASDWSRWPLRARMDMPESGILIA